MAKQQDKKWQPSSLERRAQSEQDKKMGSFRKTKQPKQPKVVEFPDIRPGGIIRLSTPLQKNVWQYQWYPPGDYDEDVPFPPYHEPSSGWSVEVEPIELPTDEWADKWAEDNL